MTQYNKYYVNVEIRTGGVIGRGDVDTSIYKKPLNEFIDYIQTEAIFKVSSRYILNNMNYVSMIYLTLDYEYHLCVKQPVDNKPLFDGDLTWLSFNYPSIYNKLMENRQVIVCYMLSYKDINNNEGYHTVDILESRIRRNNLASLILTEYEKQNNVRLIPFSILYDAHKFWLATDVFKDCKTGEDLKQVFLNGFKERCYGDIYETNKYLFEILSK